MSDKMPVVSINSKERILLSAARLFRDQGYAATTLRMIASLSEIKAGSIYYHFDSKESILIDVLNRGIENVENEVRMRINLLPSNSTFKDILKTAIEGHLAGILSNGDYTSANIKIYSQIPLKAKERHKVVRRAYADYWDSLFEEAFDNGELREALNKNVFRLFVLGSLNWTTEWYDPKRGSFEDLVDQVTAILFFGIFKK